MKRLAFLLLGVSLLASSCAMHQGLTTNLNNHATEVVLSKKNFVVVESVKGDAQATYVFGIGGLGKDALIAEARTAMLANANLVGSARAVVNETVEIKRSFFPFVRVFKVTVSAHIVEFTE